MKRDGAAANDAEIVGPRNKPKQLALWDFSTLDNAFDVRAKTKLERAVEVLGVSEVDCGPEQLSFFVPHLLGDHVTNSS
jgi:hypothetical protein